MKIVSVGWRDRGRLKADSKKIFRRLIMDRAAEDVGAGHGVVLVLGLIASLSLIGWGGHYLIRTSGFVETISSYATTEIPRDIIEVSVVGLIAALAIGVLMAFRRKLNALSWDFVGQAIFQLRRFSSTASRQTNLADVKYWLRTDPEKVATEMREYLKKSSAQMLPKRLAEALRNLATPGNDADFVVVHGLMEKKYWISYLMSGFRTPRPDQKHGGDNANYFILARMLRNAIKMSVCFDVLNVELRDEAANGNRWCWDYYSKTDYQHVPTWDEHDLPIRFRTASPHLRWPDAAKASSDGEIPIFRAFASLENPMGFRIRILRVHDIIEEMTDVVSNFFPECSGTTPEAIERRRARAARTLCLLANRSVKVVGMYDFHTMQALMGRDATDRPLLYRLDGGIADIDSHDPEEILAADWGVRWDPNRIVWSELKPTSDGELLQALALFSDAVNEAMRKRAYAIRLGRGDVAFVDNQRCVAGRFERQISKTNSIKNLLFHPGEWWVRRFYGFRKSQSNDWSQTVIGQRFDDVGAENGR